MENVINPNYLALIEILEAAHCLPLCNDAGSNAYHVLCIPTRAWTSPLFKSSSGRTEHVAVVVLMDIINRYLNVNSPHDQEQPLCIDKSYFATDLRVPDKKLEATLALLEKNGVIRLYTEGQRFWAVPHASVLAHALLPPKVLHFYYQWNAWHRE